MVNNKTLSYLPENYLDNLKNYLLKLLIPAKNLNWYIEALTHGSSLLSQKTGNNYQRLEFLGDSILGSEVSFYLFDTFPEYREGELSKVRVQMVQEKTLSSLAKKIDLPNHVIFGKNLGTIENINEKILCDVLESFVGAIYMDLGTEEVRKFLNRFFFANIEEVLNKIDIYDYKTELQEILHAQSINSFKYKIIKTIVNKEMNTCVFKAGVFLGKEVLGTGEGTSRKQAEQEAAKSALSKKINI